MSSNTVVTLGRLESLPHLRAINLGDVSTPTFAINCNSYKGKTSQVHPDREALSFYTLNHLVAILKTKFTKNEPLPLWAGEIVKLYEAQLVQQGLRLTHYMMLIVTRESRHTKVKTDFCAEMIKEFGSPCMDFFECIQNKSSSSAADWFLSAPPNTSLGNYLAFIVSMFNRGSFNGGYGGKPWGLIARTLEHYVVGKTSLEIMIDTAYTLAHNNGPMFNKGMLYEMYTPNLLKILDVQRSGQCPELCLSGEVSHLVTSEIKAAVLKVKEEYPTSFGDFVDWFKVESLGSLKKYPSEKSAQTAKHGEQKQLTPNGDEYVGKYTILPGKSALIYKRKQTA